MTEMRACMMRSQSSRIEGRSYRLSRLLDKTLDLLKSGDYYTRRDFSRSLGITNREAYLILSFLSKFNFVENVGEERLRINPRIKEFWEKL